MDAGADMEWAIHAIAVWIVFLILVDWKELKVNIWCGIFAIAIELTFDTFAMDLQLYKVSNPIISLWGSSAFFIFGPALCIGTLLSQYQPRKRWARIYITLFIAVAYTAEELLVATRHALIYLSWNIGLSAIVNLLTIISLSWFATVILQRGSTKN